MRSAHGQPCEVLVGTGDRRDARRVLTIVAAEARRIEEVRRYRDDSVVSRINRCDGEVEVDDETARLLDYSGRRSSSAAASSTSLPEPEGSDLRRQRSHSRVRTSGTHGVTWVGSA